MYLREDPSQCEAGIRLRFAAYIPELVPKAVQQVDTLAFQPCSLQELRPKSIATSCQAQEGACSDCFEHKVFEILRPAWD